MGLGQALVGEEFGEAARVSLAHGSDLPDTLPAVELQRDDGRLRVEPRDRVAGDLGAVESGDRDEGRGDGAEPERSGAAGRQREQHADPVHGLGQGVQVAREAVVGRRLLGDLKARQSG